MNHYPHHIGDFNGATRHLSRLERSIYSDLLDVYYDTEQPLPLDVKVLSRKIIANTAKEVQALKDVLSEFFIKDSDGYRNVRCDKEIAAYQGKSKKAKASAEARWSKQESQDSAYETHCLDDANACKTHDERNANQNQNQNQNQVLKKEKSAGEEKTESNLYVVPSRRTYEMFIGWKPEPETWIQTLQVSQHLVKPEQFTDYTLAEFIRSNIGKDEKTENDWQRFYVNAVARGYVKPIADKPKSAQAKKPEPEIDYSKPQNVFVPEVFHITPEEKARQIAAMKKIRESM
jgi:uncharacterized protein YdaU (DUF1376 family)